MHIITSLGYGGAQKILSSLVVNSSHPALVVSLGKRDYFSSFLEANGIDVYHINLLKNGISGLIALNELAESNDISLIQGWMYHGDLIASVIGLLSRFRQRRVQVFWNVRNGLLSSQSSKLTTRICRFILSRISHFAVEKIIYCSTNTRIIHEAKGYNPKKGLVIENGIALDFDSSPKVYSNSSNKVRFGFIGRADPQKGLHVLFGAIKLLPPTSNVEFVLAGPGVPDLWTSLGKEILNHRVILHDFIKPEDVRLLLLEVDVFILPSIYGEGFPNVLLEAMAAQTPCLVTNIGESPDIVRETGWIVRHGSVSLLAAKISEIVQLRKEDISSLGRRAMQRVEENYTLARMIEKYDHAYSHSHSHIIFG